MRCTRGPSPFTWGMPLLGPLVPLPCTPLCISESRMTPCQSDRWGRTVKERNLAGVVVVVSNIRTERLFLLLSLSLSPKFIPLLSLCSYLFLGAELCGRDSRAQSEGPTALQVRWLPMRVHLGSSYVCTLCWGLLWSGVEARNRAAARCCKGRVLKRAGPTPKTASCICMSTEQDFKEEGLRTGFETWKKRETESLSRHTGREKQQR